MNFIFGKEFSSKRDSPSEAEGGKKKNKKEKKEKSNKIPQLIVMIM